MISKSKLSNNSYELMDLNALSAVTLLAWPLSLMITGQEKWLADGAVVTEVLLCAVFKMYS